MSRYTRLLNEDHDHSTANRAPPIFAFQNNTPNNNETTNDSNTASEGNKKSNNFSSMFQSLKESAAAAGDSMRENMGKASNSVRGGLGLPPSNSRDNQADNNDDEESSVASNFVDEISEYCPQMTYQQVRYTFRENVTCREFHWIISLSVFQHLIFICLFNYIFFCRESRVSQSVSPLATS
jgi:hypothetical protein